MRTTASDAARTLTGTAEQERVLATLRAHGDELRRRGIARLYLFGSLARGDAGPGSDVDLYAVLEPGAYWSLLTLASVTARLEDILGRPVDFADVDSLRPAVRAEAEREGIEVLLD